MKELRDLKDLTIHDVLPMSDEYTTGRRHSPHVRAMTMHLSRHADFAFVSLAEMIKGCEMRCENYYKKSLLSLVWRNCVVSPPPHKQSLHTLAGMIASASERRVNTLKRFKDKGLSPIGRGQNQALTVLCVPCWQG